MFDLGFIAIMTAMSQILLVTAAGYAMVRFRAIDAGGLSLLSRLVVRFFLPCLIFDQLMRNFSFLEFANWWHFPVMGFLLAGFAFVVASLIGARHTEYRREFQALVTFQNCGYLPLVMVAALPIPGRETLLVYIFLYVIAYDVLVWTLGVKLLSGGSGRWKIRRMFSPPFVTTVLTLIGIALGMQAWIGKVVLAPVHMLGQCTLPLVLIVLGGNLAFTKLRDVRFLDAGMVVLTKLIVVPLAMLLFLLYLRPDPLVGLLLIIEAAVPSGVTLSVIAQHYDAPHKMFVNQSIFFSYLASAVTIPAFLVLYGYIY